MRRATKVILCFWALAIVASLCGLRLIATTNLQDWATIGDPPIQLLHAAYTRDGTIILDYTTEPLHTNNATAPGARCWAVLPLPPRDKSPQYIIHRRAITSADLKAATPIPILDLRGHVPTDGADRMGYDELRAFISPRFASGQHEVYFHRATYRPPDTSTVFNHTMLYIPMSSPTYGTMELFGNHPYDTYMPPSRRMVFLLVWPFAVIADWLTAPLILFIPRWN